jgi:hypothetical protein
MILEKIAIDFRCRGCSMIRRIDAQFGDRVGDHLPQGWVMETLGVACQSCANSPAAPTRHDKADEKREEVRKLRMPSAEVTTLESPIHAAVSPLVSDDCTRCHKLIAETESWRPDPEATGFAKAHRQCLIKSHLDTEVKK